MAHLQFAARERREKRQSSMGLSALVRMVQQQDQKDGDKLSELHAKLNERKQAIVLASKSAYLLDKDIRDLDTKISLLIRSRITLDEAMRDLQDSDSAASASASASSGSSSSLNRKQIELYGRLFYMLYRDSGDVLARVVRILKLAEIDALLQTVMFSLFADQFDELEEHQLLSIFARVIELEFREAQSVGSVLRANTALTRMMTTYTRRGPGQAFLKAVLTGPISEIVSEQNLVLEINPSKVYDQMIVDEEVRTGKPSALERKVEPEVAAANERVRALTAPRILRLGQIVDKIIDSIVNSLALLPYGIRWICKQIFIMAQERFGDELTQDKRLALVSGFLFLRYVNPAIVTPTFIFADVKLTAGIRRSLTLVAKIMQNLANQQSFSEVREEYMVPLNATLDKNRARVRQFLLQVVDIEDLSQHLALDRYVLLGAVDSTLHITPNEMFAVHRLLREHVDAACPPGVEGTPARIREMLLALGEAPEALPRAANTNIDLTLLPDLRDDNVEEPGMGQLYDETVFLLFRALKSSGAGTTDSAADHMDGLLNAVAQKASETGDSMLSSVVLTIRMNCSRLDLTEANGGFARLKRDSMKEMQNYGTRITRAERDVQRLALVQRNLTEHIKFLTAQKDAYRDYLVNVREQATKDRDGGKSSSKASKSDKEGKGASGKGKVTPLRVSHQQLERDGVIVSSEVPPDRRSGVQFDFSPVSPSAFEVVAWYRERQIYTFNVQIEDLLTLQEHGNETFTAEFLVFRITLLVHLLNSALLQRK